MYNPKLSIIVPVYNVEKYLARCIDSILNQSFTDFELLLIDDGSTDGSGSICDAYVEKDARIRVFHKENGGVSSARNVGLDNAIGKWICFGDSDDAFPSDALLTLMSEVDAEVSMVMGGYEEIDGKGNVAYSIPDRVRLRLDASDSLRQMFSPKYYKYQGYVWNKLFLRSIIMKYHLQFDERIKFNEDRLFTLQYICVMNGSMSYITTPVYCYYQNPNSAMASLSYSFNPDFLTDMIAFCEMRKCLNTVGLWKEVDDSFVTNATNSYRWIVPVLQSADIKKIPYLLKLQTFFSRAVGFGNYMKFWINRIVRLSTKLVAALRK